jgi:hypothetical protein
MSIKGGTFGFYCAYAYAHIIDYNIVRFLFAFKGVDIVIYIVFRSLDLKIVIRSVFEEIKDKYY